MSGMYYLSIFITNLKTVTAKKIDCCGDILLEVVKYLSS